MLPKSTSGTLGTCYLQQCAPPDPEGWCTADLETGGEFCQSESGGESNCNGKWIPSTPSPKVWTIQDPGKNLSRRSHIGSLARLYVDHATFLMIRASSSFALDPDVFEWKADIVDDRLLSGTTVKVGYLTVPLSYEENEPASNITLKLRVSMALTAPIETGKLLVGHPGGPGTGDFDGMQMGWMKYGYDGQYLSMGIQQRGLAGKNSVYDSHSVTLNPDNQTSLALLDEDYFGYFGVGNPCTIRDDVWPPNASKVYTPNEYFNATACTCWLPEESYSEYCNTTKQAAARPARPVPINSMTKN